MASRQISQQVAFALLVVATAIVILPVIVIIFVIIFNGGAAISWDFLSQPPVQAGKAGGIFPAILGTFYLMLGTIIISLPIGILAGVYLSEYARGNLFTRIINMAIVNLAGVPSIVYGLFGMAFFVSYLTKHPGILSASMTLALLVLPVIIRASEEAIRAVPQTYREAAMGLGAGSVTRWMQQHGFRQFAGISLMVFALVMLLQLAGVLN